MSCGIPPFGNPLDCAGSVFSGAASTVAGDIFGAIANNFASAADAATTWLWGQISAASIVTLDSGPGAGTFSLYVGLVAGIATFVAFALFLAELIGAVLRQDGRGLTKALSGLVVAFLGAAIAISVTLALLDAVDALSDGVLQVALGQNMSQLGKALLGGGIAATFTNPAATLLFAIVVLISVVIVWAALMIRKLLIIIAAVFAPLAFAGGTSRLTSAWVRRWIESTLALIFSKLILIFIFVIGYGILIGGLGEPAHPTAGQHVTNIAIGALTLAMAGLAPWMALKTVHFAGAHFEHLHAQAGNATAGAAKAAGMASPQKLRNILDSGSPAEGNGGGGNSWSPSPASTSSPPANTAKTPATGGSPPGGPAAAGPATAGAAAAAGAATQAARKAATNPSTVQP